MKAKLIRLKEDDKQTLGVLLFFNDSLDIVFNCKCLELPNRENKKRISRINAGKYKCILRYSEKYKWHYHLQDVEGRTLILIHFGNYYYDTKGCVLVGNDFHDINNDSYKDVTSSKKTLKRILEIAPKEFELTIFDN